MADGKSKSDICSDVVEDNTLEVMGDDDDAVQNLQVCTPVAVINASTVVAEMAMAVKKWLIESFMIDGGN